MISLWVWLLDKEKGMYVTVSDAVKIENIYIEKNRNFCRRNPLNNKPRFLTRELISKND